MRFTLLRSFTFLLMLLVTALGTGCQPSSPPPDTIVIGKLYTLNPLQPEAQAVAIQGGRFRFVGSQEETLKLADSNTTVINLDNAVGYPGRMEVWGPSAVLALRGGVEAIARVGHASAALHEGRNVLDKLCQLPLSQSHGEVL